MFKPEYIREDVAVFGLQATIALVKQRFQRLGKRSAVAQAMASRLVLSVVGA